MNVHDNQFEWSDLAYINAAQAAELEGVTVERDDVLLNITGASVARCCSVPASALPARVNQHVAILRAERAKAVGKFVEYTLTGPLGKARLLGLAQGGATREALTKGALEQFEIPVPPLRTQRKIVAILAAYDDLIENNNRRTKLLDEMAQRIYKEWFVDFRYPGHQDVPLVESDLGLIPKGWNVVAIREWATVVVGSTPSRRVPEYWRDGVVPWINSSQINDLCVTEPTELITDDAYASTSTKMMPVGTTLVAITGATLGQVSYLSIRACGSQNVCGVYSDDPTDAPYLYYAISNSIGEIANRAMGGAQQHINRGIVQEALVVEPGELTLSAFCNIADAILREIVCLLENVNVLRNTRDLLLPRLVSGEIDASDLDIAIADAAT